MGKFNRLSMASSHLNSHVESTENLAGGKAFKLDARARLFNRACTSLVGEDKFYQSGDEHDREVKRDILEVAKTHPEWILKLASYVRNEMYLRSMPVMLLCEASRLAECKPFIIKWTPSIIQRADEIVEALAYSKQYGRPGPSSLRRGLAEAMKGFDEYQILKYDKKGDISMHDALRLIHPRPENKSQDALWGWVAGKGVDGDHIPLIYARQEFDALKTWGPKAKRLIKEGHVTWEVAISKFGNRAEVWDALDLPIMAGIRNLRNLLQSGAELEPILAKLQDPEVIKRSKQLPFRFLSAFKAISEGQIPDPFVAKKVLAALETAIDLSCQNIPDLPGRTFIMMDGSGSMGAAVSGRSTARMIDVASVFTAATSRRFQETLVAVFATDFNIHDVSRMPILEGVRELMSTTLPQATYAHRPILEYLIPKKIHVDRIVVFSDLQCYGTGHQLSRYYNVPPCSGKEFPQAIAEYRAKVNRNLKVISVDLAGMGTGMLPQDDRQTALLAGWSDRIFTFIDLFDQGKLSTPAMVDAIEPREPRRPKWACENPVR